MRRTFTVMVMVIALAMSTMAVAAAKGNAAKSLGKTTFDAEVGWLVGTGQFDGEFVTAEVQGVVIGLRAQARFAGLLGVTGTNGNRVGVYEASTGSTGGNNATWNFDWHVDLSGATGNAKGKTLSDYRLVLEQNFHEQIPHTVVLALGGLHECTFSYGPDTPPGVVGVDLCEQSSNPGFGNTVFDPHVEATYHLRLVLTPETFKGPSLAVAIQVNVTDSP